MCASVERHDPRVVQHLVDNGDVVRGLKDLDVLVVPRRQNRRARVEADETPLRESAIFVTVGADTCSPHANRTATRQVLARGSDLSFDPGLERWQPAVGSTIRDVRWSSTTLAPRSTQKLLYAPTLPPTGNGPVRTVGASASVAPARLSLQSRPLPLSSSAPLGCVFGPLERRERAKVPHALQVLLAVR